MEAFFHSVRLDEEKCEGCTNCIKRCPTEAIRVRNGKAHIISSAASIAANASESARTTRNMRSAIPSIKYWIINTVSRCLRQRCTASLIIWTMWIMC